MTDLRQDPVLLRWLAALNNNREDGLARALLPDDIVIESFPHGKGGEIKVLKGFAEVLVWIRRAKPGLYQFEVLSAEASAPHPNLPAAERAIAARYRVWSTDPLWTWSNQGDWVLHIQGDTVAAVYHAPDPLPPDPED
jgi:hypothetical protein